MPRTNLGRWAGWLLLASTALLALVLVAYNTDALGDVFAQGTAGGVVLWVVTAASVIGTLVTGLVSWFRLKDHSIVVMVATIFGVLATALLGMGALPQD